MRAKPNRSNHHRHASSRLKSPTPLPDSITHAWIKLVRKCGLNGIRLHDARHTHATIMLKQGVHPKIVQERLGHSTISTTLDTYSHVAPGLQQAAATAFDDILKKDSNLNKQLAEILQNPVSTV